MRPWRGSVELLGRPIEDFERRALARALASVRQESGAAFPFTVLEVVLMGRAPHLGPIRFEGTRDLAIARAALERFGLLTARRRAISRSFPAASGGVFSWRARWRKSRRWRCSTSPRRSSTSSTSARFSPVLKQLRAERRMAVVATFHDLNVAAQYADRILLLKDGVAVGWGAPEEVLTADNLRRVYETEVYVGRNPATGALTVLPAIG